MNSKPFIILVLSTFFILASCDINSPTTENIDTQLDEIRTELQKVMLSHGIPGAVIGIFEHGSNNTTIIEEGYSDIVNLTPIKAEMKFRIASNTKTFTARRILMLVDDGKLNLDDKLNNLLPDINIQHSEIITLRQILNHTSGIVNYNGQPAFGDIWLTNATYAWTEEEILELIRNAEPDFYPGEHWNYSDSNYCLLGMIIEKVTGNTAEDEITTFVINALGLSNTSFPTTNNMPSGYCHGYKSIDSTKSISDASIISPTAPWTGGAMISNVYDLGKWAKAVGTGELITDNMKIDCFDFVPADEKSPMSYGLGVFGLFGSLRGHTGVIQGFQSCFLYSPELDVSIVAWVNKCNETQPDQPATHMVVNSFHTLYHELF